jgi:hypothetical protein
MIGLLTMKKVLFFLVLLFNFVVAKEFSKEDIKNIVLQAYIKRAELDQVDSYDTKIR